MKCILYYIMLILAIYYLKILLLFVQNFVFLSFLIYNFFLFLLLMVELFYDILTMPPILQVTLARDYPYLGVQNIVDFLKNLIFVFHNILYHNNLRQLIYVGLFLMMQ